MHKFLLVGFPAKQVEWTKCVSSSMRLLDDVEPVNLSKGGRKEEVEFTV